VEAKLARAKGVHAAKLRRALDDVNAVRGELASKHIEIEALEGAEAKLCLLPL
jgi:hypothetical protein